MSPTAAVSASLDGVTAHGSSSSEHDNSPSDLTSGDGTIGISSPPGKAGLKAVDPCCPLGLLLVVDPLAAALLRMPPHAELLVGCLLSPRLSQAPPSLGATGRVCRRPDGRNTAPPPPDYPPVCHCQEGGESLSSSSRNTRTGNDVMTARNPTPKLRLMTRVPPGSPPANADGLLGWCKALL